MFFIIERTVVNTPFYSM